MWRQGDVLFAAISALPSEAGRKHGLILARGEFSGHSHRIAEPGAAELWQAGPTLFLSILAEQATVVHEEHGPIRLPRGLYRVWQQREYTPQVIRPVVD
jgi:hypothetical protein